MITSARSEVQQPTAKHTSFGLEQREYNQRMQTTKRRESLVTHQSKSPNIFKNYRLGQLILFLLATLIANSGCGTFFGPQEPIPTSPTTGGKVPTFTPTSVPANTPTSIPTETQVPTQATPLEKTQETNSESEAESGTSDSVKTLGSLVESTAAESAPESSSDKISSETSNDGGSAESTSSSNSAAQASAPSTEPYLTIESELVNVRRGPSTAYDVVGSATTAQTFPITARNDQGDWWQVCCFGNGESGWLYGPLVNAQNTDAVVVAVDIPPLPTLIPTSVPIAEEPTPQPAEEAPPAQPAEVIITDSGGTAGNFDPNAQFHIVHYHVRGFDENNGGIFNNGGQHMIFITVLDENGNGIDGAVVKDVLADDLSMVTGNKGPGKTEFEMFWEPYKLTVASIPSGPVTSQISNQMNTAKPHIPDIVGKLGPADNEYAICPTIDDRCEPPFFHAHWSYEITFQKVR